MKNIVEALIIVICAWMANINTSHATPQLDCPWAVCNGLGGGGPPTAQPTPGPIAGTGIAYLIIYAGYRAVRRWRK